MTGPRRFLTDQEAADALGQSAAFVVELRLSGHLAYLPGRPPVIERCDLETYQRWRGLPKPWSQFCFEAEQWAEHHFMMRRLRSGYYDRAAGTSKTARR